MSPGRAGASHSLACGHPSVVPTSALQKVRPLTIGHWMEQDVDSWGFQARQLPGASGLWICGIFPAGRSSVPQKTRLGPASAVFADPPAPSPKPPDPPLLLLSCFPACVQKWGEPFLPLCPHRSEVEWELLPSFPGTQRNRQIPRQLPPVLPPTQDPSLQRWVFLPDMGAGQSFHQLLSREGFCPWPLIPPAWREHACC